MNKLIDINKANSMPSLNYLTKTFLGIELDKELTISEWKLRPLDPALLDYARMDSHMLLYLFGIINAMMDPDENIYFTEDTWLEIKPFLDYRSKYPNEWK